MKKYIKIILCIALVFCLVSCDLSAILDHLKGTTENTTNTPSYKTVALKEFINKEDVFYIDYKETHYLDSSFARETIYDVDFIFELVINSNLELEFVVMEDDEEAYFSIADEVHYNYVVKGLPYAEFLFYNENGDLIGDLDIFPNNYIAYLDYSRKINMISIVAADVDVNEVLDILRNK